MCISSILNQGQISKSDCIQISENQYTILYLIAPDNYVYTNSENTIMTINCQTFGTCYSLHVGIQARYLLVLPTDLSRICFKYPGSRVPSSSSTGYTRSGSIQLLWDQRSDHQYILIECYKVKFVINHSPGRASCYEETGPHKSSQWKPQTHH